MKLRFLAVTKQTPVAGSQDLYDVTIDHVLQHKQDGGVWENVPVVNAEDVLRDERDEKRAQALAVKHSTTPDKVLEIIRAVRAE